MLCRKAKAENENKNRRDYTGVMNPVLIRIVQEVMVTASMAAIKAVMEDNTSTNVVTGTAKQILCDCELCKE